jgi:molybdate transport system ATP-binding protein
MTTDTSSALQIRLRLPRADFALDVDLFLPRQGISVLFGASGSGKTSLLRCVAGLERAHKARLVLGPEVWQDDSTQFFLPTWRRPLGYVFQEASLFEHLDVRGNLQFGLQRAKSASGAAVLEKAIDLLGIGDLLARRGPARLGVRLLLLQPVLRILLGRWRRQEVGLEESFENRHRQCECALVLCS